MALIKCHECGKEISDLAKTCPNCGAPTNPTADAMQEVGSGLKSIGSGCSALGTLLIVIGIAIILLVTCSR